MEKELKNFLIEDVIARIAKHKSVDKRLSELKELGYTVKWDWIKFGGNGTTMNKRHYTCIQVASSQIASRWGRLAPCVIIQ